MVATPSPLAAESSSSAAAAASSEDEETLQVSSRKQRQAALKAAKDAEKANRLRNTAKGLGLRATDAAKAVDTISGGAVTAVSTESAVSASEAAATSPPGGVICPTCGFPDDYCDFGPQWDKCKVVALGVNKAKYLSYARAAGIPEDAEVPVETAVASGDKVKTPQVKKKTAPTAPQIVSIQRVNKARRKVATVVHGLETFGVKPDAAAKVFKKQFACGAAAIKSGPGLPDHVEIQGDVEDALDAVILDKFPEIPPTALVHLKAK